ncbi:iron complex transport system substrate-binding protein [Paenibacillus catalpae]|uniref:Iron complex transport system substrate-binding protein n=1 Tax=Paenibacillus catalpae TaxID=1045775 RepID=A0A1I2DWJ5_9BACL|nr:Fe(3+) dicitrate ABC transporter substrate-binding protein [Paenibacillus catalpae]SFE84603.1 iron complex transport system substrate-binding protein [Paenibacillus catalpae]
MQFIRTSRLYALALIAALALTLAACGNANNTSTSGAEASEQPSQEASSGKIAIQDELGTVELDKAPEKIVVLEFSYADALVTLGVQPVGLADDDDPSLLMDEVKDKLGSYTSVGSRYEPNLEKISSLQPDLIIADTDHHKNVLDQLKAIAPTVVLNDHLADYNMALDNYMIIAKALGKEAEGQKRLEEHKATVEAEQQKIKETGYTILPAVVNPKGFFAQSDHSFAGSFLTSIGYDDPVKNEEAYPQLSLEQLSETNPEVIVLLPTEENTIVKEWESNPLWDKLDAVAGGKVLTAERRNWALSRGLIGSEHIIKDIAAQLGE